MELMHIYRLRRVTLVLSGQTGPTESDLVSGDGDHADVMVSPDDIRLRAYLKWESAGKPPGDGVPFWLEAERELVDEQHSGPVTGNPSDILITERSHA